MEQGLYWIKHEDTPTVLEPAEFSSQSDEWYFIGTDYYCSTESLIKGGNTIVSKIEIPKS